jgi:hypothetical protein
VAGADATQRLATSISSARRSSEHGFDIRGRSPGVIKPSLPRSEDKTVVQTVLTVLTQTPAFISGNRRERLAIRMGSRRPFGIFPVAQIGRGACT